MERQREIEREMEQLDTPPKLPADFWQWYERRRKLMAEFLGIMDKRERGGD